jgi:hypothetical protein
MIDTKMLQDRSREALFASIGAGSLLVEKARDAAVWVRDYSSPEGFRTFWQSRRKRAEKAYVDLAIRGRKLADGIQRSVPVKRAGEQTKVAQRQVKAAATSVRKAVGANVEATRAAAKKVG